MSTLQETKQFILTQASFKWAPLEAIKKQVRTCRWLQASGEMCGVSGVSCELQHRQSQHCSFLLHSLAQRGDNAPGPSQRGYCCSSPGVEGLKRGFWDSQEGKDNWGETLGPAKIEGRSWKALGWIGDGGWWAGKADLGFPWCCVWGVTVSVWKGTQQPCGFPKENQTLWTLPCTGKCGRSGTATNWVLLSCACSWNLIARLLLVKIKVCLRESL